MPATFRLNGDPITLDDNDDGNTPLLWAIREMVGLRGTKFGCGRSFCGGLHGASRRAGDPFVRHAARLGGWP